MKVRVCLDWQRYFVKPEKSTIIKIGERLPAQEKIIELTELAYQVGERGRSFTSAQFTGIARKGKEMAQMQIFGIDIDHGITIKEAMERAKHYKLPVAFSYHTLRSTKEAPRFRMVFVHEIPIYSYDIAKMIIKMLLRIFPEADKQCSDVNRFFMGGKGLIGEVHEETFNIADLAFQFQHYLYSVSPNKYVRNLERFAKSQDVQLVQNCLQIFRVHEDGSDVGGENGNGSICLYG